MTRQCRSRSPHCDEGRLPPMERRILRLSDHDWLRVPSRRPGPPMLAEPIRDPADQGPREITPPDVTHAPIEHDRATDRPRHLSGTADPPSLGTSQRPLHPAFCSRILNNSAIHPPHSQIPHTANSAKNAIRIWLGTNTDQCSYRRLQ